MLKTFQFLFEIFHIFFTSSAIDIFNDFLKTEHYQSTFGLIVLE